MSLRKMRNTSINVSPNTSPNTSIVSTVSTVPPCIICLDEVRCRGKITVCEHWFCFGCIVEWSKNTNTCPICKARFRTISKARTMKC
ncbi:hypothetical protein QZH41_013261 [Actinostola sp. cb2023]|nr:hypothetical protein QZH41_013261 [Actinostola sp. cb2023]